VPKTGANGLNPEFGHVKTDYAPDARPCLCGAAGCVMRYCSMFGMLLGAGKLTGVPFPPLDSIETRFEELIGDVAGSDAVANRAVGDAALHFGRALAGLLNTADPGDVLIAVWNDAFLATFENRVREVLEELTLPAVLAATNIRYIVADRNWRRTGTAALALEQTYLSKL
jgi:predicted NBD/HSP70 family sugar kinase